jgi:serine/threonine protein kinase/photosystem II stability/assembly factor-like uncharacterized protein
MGVSAGDTSQGAAVAAPAFSEPLPKLPGYEIVGELGRGGMGVVYKAQQVKLKRLVAIKMIIPDRVAGSQELARFQGEAEAVARLQHPSVVHIYQIGRKAGRTFIVLEFVGGGSLAHKLRGTPQPPREAAQLVETLARAVEHAHKHDIIHRDLKPANILLTPEGHPKITDFGLAKQLDAGPGQTASGAIMGTPSYMAPEQAAGRTHQIGPPADVYGLGAILYELLTGRPPFRGETALETLQQVVADPPQPPSRLRPGVPPELEAICLKCLKKDPAARYASAEALADALHRFLTGDSTRTQPPAPPLPVRGGRKLNCLLATIAGGLTTLLVFLSCVLALGLWITWGRTRPSWEALQVGSEAEHFERLAFPSRTMGYAASRQGIFKTEDGGKKWRPILQEAVGRVYLLQFADERTGWLGTDQLRQTEDGGVTWAPVPLPGKERMQSVNGLVRDADGWALVAGSTAAGELAMFSRRPGAAGWEKLDPAATGCWGGQGAPFRRWFPGRLALLGPQQAVLVLYKGYEDGGALLRTTDGGNTWTTLFTADQDLYDLHFTDGRHGWLAGFHGSLWRTEDGGNTWAAQPTPGGVTASCLAFAPRDGSLGVAPLWNGKVLLTTGQGWQTTEVPLGYSMPSAAVVDAGCAYVLGSEGHLAHYNDPRVLPVK